MPVSDAAIATLKAGVPALQAAAEAFSAAVKTHTDLVAAIEIDAAKAPTIADVKAMVDKLVP